MNRRDLFRGAGALALTAAMPDIGIPITPAAPALTREQIAEKLAEVLANSAWWAEQCDAVGRLFLYGSAETTPLTFEGLKPRYHVRPGFVPVGVVDDDRPVLVQWGPSTVMHTDNVYADPISWTVLQDPEVW